MRDIRADLQDRANLLKEQMDAAQAQFKKHADQIKQEHDNKLKDLKADLDATKMLIEAEQRRFGDTPPAPTAQLQPQEPSPQQPRPRQAHPRMPLADMIEVQRAS